MVGTSTYFTHDGCDHCDLIIIFFGAAGNAGHIDVEMLSKFSILGNHTLDFHCGTAGACGQLANLIGYHCKAMYIDLMVLRDERTSHLSFCCPARF